MDHSQFEILLPVSQ